MPPYSKNNSCHDPNVNNNVNVNNFLRGNEKCFKYTERYCRNATPTHFISIHECPGLPAPAVHPSKKPGTTCVASCSDALENKPTSNSLRTKKGQRKVRRGLRKRKGDGFEKSSGTCNFYCANVNGFKSKADSINQIILEHNIDVVLLCETKVYSNSAIGIRGFQSFPAVMQKNCGGGLYIGIRHGLCESVMTDSGRIAEFITVRPNCWDRGLRVILVYGPQEYDSEENRNDFYDSISVEIERSYLNGDSFILAGDFNAKLGSSIIKNDIHLMSQNGGQLYT